LKFSNRLVAAQLRLSVGLPLFFVGVAALEGLGDRPAIVVTVIYPVVSPNRMAENLDPSNEQ